MLFLDTAAEVSGDTLSPVVALATLEQFMVENPYVGRPVIHVSPFTATVLVANHLLVQDLDGTLRTALGTLVVVGSGYRARDDDSNALMWITTAINIWRGPVVANVASNIVLNRGDALAEQIYSITTECQDLSGVIRINMEGI